MMKVEITNRTIIFTVLFLVSLYLLLRISDIVLLLFIAMLFTSAINPFVSKLEARQVPRGLSIAIVYVVVIGILGIVIANIVPQLIFQGSSLISQINVPPALTKDLSLNAINLENLQIIANQLTSVPRILNVIFSAFSSVIAFFSFIVLSFYLLMERPHIHKYLIWLFPDTAKESKAERFIGKFEAQIGSWVRGECTLMFVVGLLTYIGLILLGINYALPLALLAGILELLPNIGPTVAAIPAIIVAYISFSPTMALAVTALYILIQQLENNFIVPFIMRQAVGLSPIITILLLLIGFRLGGVGGSILSIPIFLTLKVIAVEFYRLKEPVEN